MTIAAYIREDLKARILSGNDVPDCLTLRDLSSKYGVSLTPVRQAVEDLIEQRLLRKEPNGRLAVEAEAVGRIPHAKREDVLPPGAWDQIIARDVMKLSLLGREEFMREEVTAEKYGIGRTLLRHVLSRLTASGILEHVPRRGWRVRPFREEDMRAYLEVRELLELKALDLCRERVAKADLARILEDNVVSGERPKVDAELHAYIVEKAENRYIQDFFSRHGAYFTTLFYYAALGASVTSEMAKQHRKIVESMLAGRWPRAREEMAEHIRAQRPAMRRMMDRLAGLPVQKWPEIPTAPSARL
ncbi:MAG TPA: GntR family transcriptional regulator [Planctomycetota bacterium]